PSRIARRQRASGKSSWPHAAPRPLRRRVGSISAVTAGSRSSQGCSCHGGRRRRHTLAAWRGHRGGVNYLSAEEQIFVLYQIRNWVFGRYEVFQQLNVAWSLHGAAAYFWN